MNVLRSKSNLEVLSGRAEDDGVEFSKIRDDRIGPQNRRRCPRSSRPSKASVLRANTMEHARMGRGACNRRILILNGTDQSDQSTRIEPKPCRCRLLNSLGMMVLRPGLRPLCSAGLT